MFAIRGQCYISEYTSPYGDLVLGAVEERLCLCDWKNRKTGVNYLDWLQRHIRGIHVNKSCEVIEQAVELLNAYFSKRVIESEVSILMVGTDFQKKVWRELLLIRRGENISYLQLAKRLGMLTGVRAVANAVGANRLSLIVPCHRIVGSNGKLGGYAGGVEAKKGLLNLEKTGEVFLLF